MKERKVSSDSNLSSNIKKRKTIYDKIILSPKSRTIVILRTMIISLCCFFFPYEAIVDNRLQQIEMQLYVENDFLSLIFSIEFLKNNKFHTFIDIIMKMIGTSDAIMVFISIIYLIIHPFIGLKLILISSVTQYFVILLQILFQAHRPFWDLEKLETICRNTYPNPSSRLFYCSFFYLYSIISFNLLKKKKFSKTQKLIMSFLYIIMLIILLIMFGGTYLLYMHQIIYTFVISIVVICLLIDFDTKIHNFIFNSLKNVYNTRVYKMKIFFFISGLFFIGFISMNFIEENDINKIKDKISLNPKCTDDDREMFGIKQGLLNISFLSGVVGAFWGASFTVEKKVGKWWSILSFKKSIIKLFYIGIVCSIFILFKYYIKIIKKKFELYFALEAILDYFESYFIFGLLPLFFQYMGFNEQYIKKNYQKIKVNLRDDNDVQFFRATIFENETKGKKKGKKKDEYVVIDRDVDLKRNENEEINLKDNINKENEEKENKINEFNENKIEEKEENEENENNEIYQPTSMIINNVKKHEEEEGELEFYIENENKNISNLEDLKNDLIIEE